jgi:hypothetical protein
MFTKRPKPKPCLIAFLLLCVLCALCGCADSFRFAPSQAQKQSAELTHGLAVKINSEGTQSASLASQQLVAGTAASLSYIGRPSVPPDMSQLPTITEAAKMDANKRPDPWQAADNFFEIALGVAGIIGGVGGIKALNLITLARQKSKALEEVIAGNELFKGKAPPEAVRIFKNSQVDAQSDSTAQIVAQLKA